MDPYSLQSTVRENLWIVGELLDVTGLLGGYNLHWPGPAAWPPDGPGPVRGQIDIFHFYGGRGALEKAPLFLRTMP